MAKRVTGTSQGNRRTVAKFAAHLAHLLNQGDRDVELKPFDVYQKLQSTLVSDGGGGRSENYRDRLVGYQLFSSLMSSEEAAQKYFDAVVDRPLFLARDKPVHTAHKLFEALCQRGNGALPNAKLVRKSAKEQNKASGASLEPEIAGTFARLANLRQDISNSNPARMQHDKHGPLFLCITDSDGLVAEEMSVWGAIICCPRHMRKLARGVEFNAFCSLVIKTIEAANAPYGALISIGLPPHDWASQVTINTSKKISIFLNAISEDLIERSSKIQTLDSWEAAWQRQSVPGFKSVEQFWNSEIGRQLRSPAFHSRVEVELETLGGQHLQDAEFLDSLSFEKALASCEADGALTEYDVWFLRELYGGGRLSDILDAPRTVAQFGKDGIDIQAYASQLQARVAAFVGNHPDSDHIERILEASP